MPAGDSGAAGAALFFERFAGVFFEEVDARFLDAVFFALFFAVFTDFAAPVFFAVFAADFFADFVEDFLADFLAAFFAMEYCFFRAPPEMQSLRHFVSRLPAPALAAGLAFFLGLSGFASLPGEPYVVRKIPPDRAACERLYEHQLKLLREDPDNPFYASVNLNIEALQNEASREAEVKHCIERTSIDSYNCQFNAKSFAELVQCRGKFPDRQNNEESKQPETDQPTGVEVDRTPEKQNGGAETMPTGRFTVNATNCDRAYDHMYRVITASAKFNERKDRERLLKYWESGEAKNSFRQRCLSDFQPSDLGCLIATKDPDVLQGCLLVIPPR